MFSTATNENSISLKNTKKYDCKNGIDVYLSTLLLENQKY